MRMLKELAESPRARARPTARSRSTESPVEVVRKRIKNFYLRVDRQQGRVRLSAPRNASDDEVRLVVQRRIDWIKRQQAQRRRRAAASSVRGSSPARRIFSSAEPLRLEVVEREGRGSRVVRTAINSGAAHPAPLSLRRAAARARRVVSPRAPSDRFRR